MSEQLEPRNDISNQQAPDEFAAAQANPGEAPLDSTAHTPLTGARQAAAFSASAFASDDSVLTPFDAVTPGVSSPSPSQVMAEEISTEQTLASPAVHRPVDRLLERPLNSIDIDSPIDSSAAEAGESIKGHPAPDPAIWESIAPKEKAPITTTPDNVKFAGVLLIIHGICLSVNGVMWARQENDWASAIRALLWLGCTLVLAGALFDRRIWAWWIVTLGGGCAGVLNLMSTIGFFLQRSLGADQIAQFFPPAIGAAAGAMLICVMLLMSSDAKEAFGITKENPTGLF